MKIAIMQPYIFPYIGYWQLINSVDKFIVFDDVNFIKKGWINRNNLLINGQASLFTIPLVGASQNKKINTIKLLDEKKWKIKLLKTIKSNYSKAAQFNLVYPLIEKIINIEEEDLSDFLVYQIQEICNFLNIKTNIKSSRCYENQYLKGENRIIDICLQEKCDTYVNPIGGVDLYNKKLFNKNNINLFFLKTHKTEYAQFKKEFIPFLSIIDILMFNTVEEIKIMLTKFELT